MYVTCKVLNCNTEKSRRGYCGLHYARWWRYGDPNFSQRVQRYAADAQCSVAECPDRPKSRGFCELHFDRVQRHGDPNVLLVDSRPASERWRDLYEVTNLGHGTPCWLWTGRVGAQGYGRIKDNRKASLIKEPLAHRFVYEQVTAQIPDGLTLDHLCHNDDKDCSGGIKCLHRRCVNPDHLEPVTTQVNTSRGKTPSAINAAKTHCNYGHEFTPGNTGSQKSGRTCRACSARRQREFRARKRLEAKEVVCSSEN